MQQIFESINEKGKVYSLLSWQIYMVIYLSFTAEIIGRILYYTGKSNVKEGRKIKLTCTNKYIYKVHFTISHFK